jgi:hypothetical protein
MAVKVKVTLNIQEQNLIIQVSSITSNINNKGTKWEIRNLQSSPPQLKQRGFTKLACLYDRPSGHLLAAFKHQ